MVSEEVWSGVLSELELAVSRAYFESCIKRLVLVESRRAGPKKQGVVVGCPSVFIYGEVKRRFYNQIRESLSRVVGEEIDLELVVKEKGRDQDHQAMTPLFKNRAVSGQVRFEKVLRRVGLTRECNLETFAVSSSNEMAYAAAKAISKSPGRAYNPLFLYGGVGVGKTHLMQAVGQEILKEDEEVKTIYCTGEVFTNEIIEAIRGKTTSQFKKRYRSVSLLLIDDVQFIAGKTTVQEEFFHTFNAVLNEGGQIIMTSDKPPKEIGELEDRLRSRFEGGLIIDIGEPNFELRTAILMIKAKQMGVGLPLGSARLVAEKVDSTRALIGVLMRLKAEESTRLTKITDEVVVKVLASQEKQEGEKLSKTVVPDDVVRLVAEYYGVEENEVRGARRVKRLVLPRHVAMFLLNRDLNSSLVEVGGWFGGRDHTTVLHAVDKIEGLKSQDKQLENDIEKLRKQIYS